MKIAFTICSNNYLAQAKILYESFVLYNPDYQFIIGLCDKKSSLIDYDAFDNCTFVEAEDLYIKNFEVMCIEYDIVELNTSIKPFLFKYIFDKYNAELAIYLDPDTCVFNSFDCIEKELVNYDILLTPHICSPIPQDGHKPQENIFLNYGIYNLGFLALNQSDIVFDMLTWWASKLENNCYNNVSDGYFVDQLPMNYVPIFFDRVSISKNLGLNVAYWNFHEREISKVSDIYKINNDFDLVFFHFSNFKASNEAEITPFFSRFKMSEKKVIKELYNLYYNQLVANKYFEYADIQCYYVKKRLNYLANKRLEALKAEPLSTKLLRGIKRRVSDKVNDLVLRYSQL